MGAAQSDAFAEAIPAIPESAVKGPGAGPRERTTKLYKFVTGGQAGAWTLVTSYATPNFYNANEDKGAKVKPDWHLEIDGSDVDVPVTFDTMNYDANIMERRVTFSAHDAIWALRFSSEEQFRAFANDLSDKTFTNMSGLENDEAVRTKELGADFGGLLFSRVDGQVAIEPMEIEVEADVPAAAELKEKKTKAVDKDSDISGVLIGAGENNFLMRGSHFDVLRNIQGGVEDKDVSFTLTPQRPSAGGRAGSSGSVVAALTPSRVLLANAERSMIMLTPENKHVMHMADIETGSVVRTFKFEKDGIDIPMLDIHHDNKAAQTEMRSTFIGLDSNRICRWDARERKGMVGELPLERMPGGHDYSRGTNFTCMATSGDGCVAIGSKDGKVRLYSNKTEAEKSLSRASTAVPGLGSPITAIDVTYDGKYVVATTDKYLMIVKTTYTDDKGRECNGFVNKMGGRGAVPRLLRLKPEDAARTGGKPFAKGKFTWITESGVTERWVVAQCGNFSVVWNFKRIRSMASETLSFGGMPTCMDYIMSAREEDVVDAAFLHPRYAAGTSDGASLVVATQHNLFNLNG